MLKFFCSHFLPFTKILFYFNPAQGTSKPKKRLREEGRLAIVSRNSETKYVKVVVPKPESVKRLIHDAIAANILFKACSSEELIELVEVFAPSEASEGSTIIRQGDEGDAFYVMERGTVDVYEGDTHKATLYSGTSFGEIALLYGCPRSATLRTRYFCKLWSISRSAFRAITSQFKQQRMEAKVKFLKKVIIFMLLNFYPFYSITNSLLFFRSKLKINFSVMY